MALLLGEKLTIDGLLQAFEGAPFDLDRDAMGQLSTEEGKTVEFDPSTLAQISTEYTRPILAATINQLIRGGTGGKVRTATVEKFAGAQSVQEGVDGAVFTEPEVGILKTPSTPLSSCLGTMLACLSRAVPAAQCTFALYIECTGFNAGFISTSLQTKQYKGILGVIENLEILLANSKLAKKNFDSEAAHILETPQNIGDLVDLCIEGKRTVEVDINAKPASGKFMPTQSTSHLGRLMSQMGHLLTILITDTAQRIGSSDITAPAAPTVNMRDSASVSEGVSQLSNIVTSYIELIQQELNFAFSALSTEEAKINEGQTRHRPLNLGKGTRPLYEYLKKLESLELPGLYDYFRDHLAARNEERRAPKLPKGTRDFGINQMAIREKAFNIIKGVFKRHCAGEIDTPVFELKETLMGKYGEEGNKLIYDLADQGGEILSLRYDLTVPFARFVAMNRIARIKRFHIAKVYRRDQPQMNKGRFREFYQCDFDIAGQGSPMFQDAEILKIVDEILAALEIGGYQIKINHRSLLDAYMEISGVPPKKFRTISSSIDKLDKAEWAVVRAEMINEKGLDSAAADALEAFVAISGSPRAIYDQLMQEGRFAEHKAGKKALDEMGTLITYCEFLGVVDRLSFDLSLARGLDYYTGLIYEAILTDSEFGVGSIAGGGRYDELIMRLNNSKTPTPSVGVSIGIERVISILEKKQASLHEKRVLVAQAGRSNKFNLSGERLKLCNMLWANGFNAETSYKEKSDPEGQTRYALENYFTFIVWIGESELDAGQVKVKHLESHDESLVAAEDLLTHLSSR